MYSSPVMQCSCLQLVLIFFDLAKTFVQYFVMINVKAKVQNNSMIRNLQVKSICVCSTGPVVTWYRTKICSIAPPNIK